jgi:hypothetical protein
MAAPCRWRRALPAMAAALLALALLAGASEPEHVKYVVEFLDSASAEQQARGARAGAAPARLMRARRRPAAMRSLRTWCAATGRRTAARCRAGFRRCRRVPRRSRSRS